MSNRGHLDVALREFHVASKARKRYEFDDTLFSLSGNVLFANFHAARVFAQKMNEKRNLAAFPENAVRASQINAMGLIDEILHYIVGIYREQQNAQVMKDALDYLENELGNTVVNHALHAFIEAFPPVAVYRGRLSVERYLAGETKGTSHRQVALEEMLLLWLANVNPAFSPFMELFDDSELDKNTGYRQVIDTLHTFFEAQPHFGPDNQNLIDMLRAPALQVPHSLQGQLDYIRKRWAGLLGKYLYRLLSSLDFIAEEDKLFFGLGPGPESLRPYEFGDLALEVERFSPDSHWMPRLVMMAKNAYVWLDQLSKAYGRPITRLDQIPDEALDKLARGGFTGLWLIGLWQRSEASKRIKQIMGNPEAVASAYSLHGYRIADDLGGEGAFENLKARAWQRGIRMGSDMVPNHMGIDSTWVMEHPDWFISLDYSPFPSYTFNGEDLCNDPRVSIYIEDHYYTRTDAAVVFKRVDHWTGQTAYIYHGNDGTSMPWNDTAQLNYLKQEVREAVIQTILAVARRSPIIRFDAAMTLAKKHYQRLWYPEPGTGGDIPSRADHGMTKAQFDAVFPQEFWREVVDRVAQEAPDTLLLAEAFWLMEGYFVRTLGMHRVYNSAFMNMMRDEKNAEYRQLIKNTLEFDPQILKRYVNFMNNPDERTAVDQFGKGDKYFGICTMMATLPGLPMFGHGQIEGYAEKYGMEFRRAYWDETPDPYLVERHERQIFPLLHRRATFAEVEDFLLYDFYTPAGHVDENVFAYSNHADSNRALVLYHNKYAETQGWIRTSAAYAVKDERGEKRLVQKSLAEGLGISKGANTYLIFRDAITGLEYIRNCKTLWDQGLYAQLHAYQVHVFTDLREVHDNEARQYAQLNTYLNGRGVPDIQEALKELILAPIHTPLRMLISGPAFQWLINARTEDPESKVGRQVLEQVEQKMKDLLQAIQYVTGKTGDVGTIVQEIRQELAVALTLSQIENREELPEGLPKLFVSGLEEGDPVPWGILIGWLFTHALGKLVNEDGYLEISRSWIDEWLIGKHIAQALQELDVKEDTAREAVSAVKVLLAYPTWIEAGTTTQKGRQPYAMLKAILEAHEVQAYLKINRYQGVLWFNKEFFEQLLQWVVTLATIETLAENQEEIIDLEDLAAWMNTILDAEVGSGYQVEKLLEDVRVHDSQGGS